MDYIPQKNTQNPQSKLNYTDSNSTDRIHRNSQANPNKLGIRHSFEEASAICKNEEPKQSIFQKQKNNIIQIERINRAVQLDKLNADVSDRKGGSVCKGKGQGKRAANCDALGYGEDNLSGVIYLQPLSIKQRTGFSYTATPGNLSRKRLSSDDLVTTNFPLIPKRQIWNPQYQLHDSREEKQEQLLKVEEERKEGKRKEKYEGKFELGKYNHKKNLLKKNWELEPWGKANEDGNNVFLKVKVKKKRAKTNCSIRKSGSQCASINKNSHPRVQLLNKKSSNLYQRQIHKH